MEQNSQGISLDSDFLGSENESIMEQKGDNENNSPASVKGLVARKGIWKKEEDELLLEFVNKYGENDWKNCSKSVLGRNSRQCKDRWHNVLNPNIEKNKTWSPEEEYLIFKLVNEIGQKWKKIRSYIKARSESAIKNRFYSLLRSHSGLAKISNSRNINEELIKHFDTVLIKITKGIDQLMAQQGLKFKMGMSVQEILNLTQNVIDYEGQRDVEVIVDNIVDEDYISGNSQQLLNQKHDQQDISLSLEETQILTSINQNCLMVDLMMHKDIYQKFLDEIQEYKQKLKLPNQRAGVAENFNKINLKLN